MINCPVDWEVLLTGGFALPRDGDSTTSLRLWVHLNSLGERRLWVHLNSLGEPVQLLPRVLQH